MKKEGQKGQSPKGRFRTPGRLIMGKNCIDEVLEVSPERFIQIYSQKGGDSKDPLLAKIGKLKIPLTFISKQELFSLVGSESHQGFVAAVHERGAPTLKELIKKLGSKKRSLFLMLDSINDPQNLGTLLRAAECFGVDAVIWSKNRGADVTPVVTKASVGASEIVTTIKVSNLSDTVRELKKENFFVVTAELKEESQDLYSFQFPEKVLLIVGSEGEGIRQLLSSLADAKVQIPMHGKINSLNVSQATSVILSYWRQK